MPIEQVDVPSEIPYIQILDKDGNVDEELEPEIPDADLVDLYRTMLTSRKFDDRRMKLQRQGRIGTFAPSRGQEAAQVGSVYAIRDDDWMIPSFRELTANLWRGFDLEDDLLYAAGYEVGMDMPSDSKNLPIAIPVASQICHGAGVAWAAKLKGSGRVGLTYFGDGATSEGDFHEGLNFAGVFGAPCVFVCQNNQWAISVPRERQTASDTLAQKALAYDIPGIQVDGNDVLGMYHATKRAVERARDGDGPTMIEALTYRMGVHTTADDPTKYRDEEDVEPWRERDPLKRFRKYLEDRDLIDQQAHDEMEEEIDDRISQAVENFEDRAEDLGDPVDMFDHQYKELPPYVEKQKEELTEYWREHDIWGDHSG